VLQVDCPDLAMGRHLAFPDLSNAEFLKIAAANVEALNHALRDIPLRAILGIALKARPQALSFEGANPRHEHEWVVFREVKLPDDRIIIPGVLDSTTNFIEHPELVAQRLVRYAEVVGRERVMAGSDCGFATFARSAAGVEPEIAWAKLRSMAEGARLASAQLWRG
jgi:5-methyltetrahydropteroyltriglutamate--homocysteine methyltransferase